MTVEKNAGQSVATPGRDWFRSAAVYQICPRDFAASNGDGVGDLRGVISKLRGTGPGNYSAANSQQP